VNPKVLWINPQVKSCAFCWFADGEHWKVASHMEKQHPTQVRATATVMGLDMNLSLFALARKIVEARPPGARIPHEIPRVDS